MVAVTHLQLDRVAMARAAVMSIRGRAMLGRGIEDCERNGSCSCLCGLEVRPTIRATLACSREVRWSMVRPMFSISAKSAVFDFCNDVADRPWCTLAYNGGCRARTAGLAG